MRKQRKPWVAGVAAVALMVMSPGTAWANPHSVGAGHAGGGTGSGWSVPMGGIDRTLGGIGTAFSPEGSVTTSVRQKPVTDLTSATATETSDTGVTGIRSDHDGHPVPPRGQDVSALMHLLNQFNQAMMTARQQLVLSLSSSTAANGSQTAWQAYEQAVQQAVDQLQQSLQQLLTPEDTGTDTAAAAGSSGDSSAGSTSSGDTSSTAGSTTTTTGTSDTSSTVGSTTTTGTSDTSSTAGTTTTAPSGS
ncbi:MAG: hypothetical protein K6T26_01660 [Alicyclobacillus sp.]|nr:hypothetical protein [Alicyclobacillus sp.]